MYFPVSPSERRRILALSTPSRVHRASRMLTVFVWACFLLALVAWSRSIGTEEAVEPAMDWHARPAQVGGSDARAAVGVPPPAAPPAAPLPAIPAALLPDAPAAPSPAPLEDPPRVVSARAALHRDLAALGTIADAGRISAAKRSSPAHALALFDLVREHLPRLPLGGGTDGVILCEVGVGAGLSAAALLAGAAAAGVRVGALHAFDNMADGASVLEGIDRLKLSDAARDVHVTLTPGACTDTLQAWVAGAGAAAAAAAAGSGPPLAAWQRPPCDLVHLDGGSDFGEPAESWRAVQPLVRSDSKTLVLFGGCACGDGDGAARRCAEPTATYDRAVATGAIVHLVRGGALAAPSQGTCAGWAVVAPAGATALGGATP